MRQRYRKKPTNSTETHSNPVPQFYPPFGCGVPVPELCSERKRAIPERIRLSDTFTKVDDAVVCGIESADDDYWQEPLEWVETKEEKASTINREREEK